MADRLKTLVDSSTASTGDLSWPLGTVMYSDTFRLQLSISAAASVQLYQKLADDAPWVAVGSAITASGLTKIDAAKWLRVVWSGNTGTLNAWAWSYR